MATHEGQEIRKKVVPKSKPSMGSSIIGSQDINRWVAHENANRMLTRLFFFSLLSFCYSDGQHFLK
jgi:hypothetical protein